jgi:hypothetical protein
MSLPEFVTSYFGGELREALIFILPFGLLSLVFGLWLWIDTPTSFTRGVAIPFLVMGLVMTTVGGGVGFRTPSQLRQLDNSVRLEPAQTVAAEVARMAGVNARWVWYLWAWAAFGVAGLALRFGAQHPGARGLGAALVLFCGVGLLVDGFAERRAHEYAAALAQWHPERPD